MWSKILPKDSKDGVLRDFKDGVMMIPFTNCQQDISLVRSKILPKDLKDCMMMIPFTNCLQEDGCPIYFKFSSE